MVTYIPVGGGAGEMAVGYWKPLTIVLLEIYTICQAEFPGLIVHMVASNRHNKSYNKGSHLDL